MKKHLGYFTVALLSVFGLISLVSDYGETASPARSKNSKIQNRKVSNGDTVYGILKAHGFTDVQRNLAIAQSPIPRGFTIAPGDIYQVAKTPETNRLEVNFFDNFQNLAYKFWKSPDASGVAVKENALRSEIGRTRGVINGSLIQSIQNLVGDEMVAYRFMDAFTLDFNLKKDIQRGAKFAITFEKLYSDKQFIRFGEILRAELDVRGEKIVREFKATENGGVFLDAVDNHDDRPFYSPVDYIRVSSLFQPSRFHPVRKRRIAHLGIDFELPEGEPIYAVKSGTVLRAGRNRGSGRFVVLRHSNGLESYYNHMSEIAGKMYPGVRVEAGAQVGKIGCTGYCTKPHLHFAVKRYGKFVDPKPLIKRYSFAQRGIGRKTVDVAYSH